MYDYSRIYYLYTDLRTTDKHKVQFLYDRSLIVVPSIRKYVFSEEHIPLAMLVQVRNHYDYTFLEVLHIRRIIHSRNN